MNSEDRYETNLKNAELIHQLAETEGKLESPIDLDISHMRVIELNPLRWFNMDKPLKKWKITNTGYTVILCAKSEEEAPCISGGPFKESYVFSQIHFHWGKNEMNGSEHCVDGGSMPMELHAVYFKSDYETLENALHRVDGVSILVYFVKLQGSRNQLLEEIVKGLQSIKKAHSSVRLIPAPMSTITRPFNQDYFLYWGSIVSGQNSYSILWMVSREPIGISVDQVAEFRTLNDEKNAPIMSNCRPLKGKRHRHVFHVSPSGSTYASLLPIPRDLPAPSEETIGNNATAGNS